MPTIQDSNIRAFWCEKTFICDKDAALVVLFILEFYPSLHPDICYNKGLGEYFICFTGDKP